MTYWCDDRSLYYQQCALDAEQRASKKRIHDTGSNHTYSKINGFIYGQDGQPVPLSVKDTKENRQFMEWLRIHDRSK